MPAPLSPAQAASNAAMSSSGNYVFANGSGTLNGANYGAGSFNPNTGGLNTGAAPSGGGGAPAGWSPAAWAQQQADMAKYFPNSSVTTMGRNSQNTPIAPTVTPNIKAGDIGTASKPLTLTPTTPLSDINQYVNGLITQQDASNPLQQTRSSLESTLTGLFNTEATKGQRFDQLNNQYGVPNMVQQLNDLNLQIAQRKNFFTQQDQTAENKAIPTPFIVGEQSQIQRQSAIELGALAATAQAYQGNINLANDTIDRTLKMEFEPVENQINQTKTLLDLNYQDLTSQEKRQADLTKTYLDKQQSMVDDLKAAKKDAYTAVLSSVADPHEKSNAALDIARATSPDEAYQVAAKYSTPKPNTQVVDFGGNKVLIDSATGRTVKVLGSSESGGGSVTVPNNANLGGLSKPLQDAFNGAILGLTATQAKTASAAFTNLVNAGDLDGAKNYIIRVAMASAPVQEQSNAIGRKTAVAALTDIQKLLEQAKAGGADTGLLSGKIQQASEGLGRAGNQDLAYIGNQIGTALQSYRRAMTGVAFSPSEAAQYKKIFPDITDVSTLNTAKIDSLLDSFDRNNKQVLSFYIGDSNYNALYGKSATPLLPSQRTSMTGIGDKINTAVTHGYTADQIVPQLVQSFPDLQAKIQQALQSGFSNDDILNYLKTQ